MKHSKALTSASAGLKASRGRAILASIALLASMLTGAVMSPASAVAAGITVNFEAGDTSGWVLGGTADFGAVVSSETTTVPSGGPAGSTKSATAFKPAGSAFWGGTSFLHPVDTATSNLISAGNKTASMKVYAATAGQVVRLKLETFGDPTKSVEANASAATVVGWQTMNFDFANQVSGTAAWNAGFTYNVASVFFDFAANDAAVVGGTYYFDDIVFPGAVVAGAPVVVPVTDTATLVSFETSDTSGYALGGTSDFGGTASSLSATPPAGGSSGSVKAGKVIKTAGAQTWAGVTFLGLSASPVVLANAAHKVVTANVYSPVAGRVVRLKVEDAANAGVTVESDAAATTVVGWQTMTFNFATPATGTAAWSDAATYNKASFFFSFGNTPAADETYYFDDVAFMGAVTPALAGVASPILVSFETSDTSGYALGGTSDFGGTASSLSATPPAGGSSGSVKAGKVIKTAGAQTWAGVTFLGLSASPVVLANAAHKVVTANVYSPVAGRVVRLKVEDAANAGVTVESDAAATTVVGWQTMTFNFATPATGTAAWSDAATYNKASFFFSFGNTPAADETYYFDDVAFMGAVTPALAVLHAYPFTVTSTTELAGSFTASVTAKQTAGAHNYATLSAPDAGYTGTIDATHWAYLTISNGSFAASGTNVSVAGARADIIADGPVSLNVWVPDTKTATVKLVSAVAVNGVVTETTLQTISITGTIPAAAVVSSGIVSPTKSWTLLRSHWSSWDPAQKTDDKVVLGTSGSDSPAFIEGHLYDTTGETMTGMHVTVATTGPVVVGVNQYEAPYASRTGGLNTHRAITSDTITASNAFTVLVSGDGSGRGGVGTITISVNGTVIATKTVTVTGPVTGIKGVVNNPVIAAGPVSGYLSPTGSATTFGKAITFVAADATGSISYAGYEAMTVTTSDTSVATAALASDDYGNRFVALTGLKPGKVDVIITNAAGKAFPVGSVTVISPVIASLVATPAKASVAAGESSTVTLVAKNADGVPVPDGTYTLASGNWYGSQFFFPTVNGVFTFVDGSASMKVYAPNAAGPFQLSLGLNSNAVLASALQGTTLTAILTVAPVSNTSAAVTALSAALQSLIAKVAQMSATFTATFKLLTSRIKAAYAALAKLKAPAKR